MIHGHEKMINWLSEKPYKELSGKTLVEIGTVREIIPGQNSTLYFAEFCNNHNINFITVDMNPETIDKVSKILPNNNFKTVCSRGEDFLKNPETKKYVSEIDYIYFDAFDFNHKNHSQKRRNDYQKYLGCDIQDELCHQSHLDMAINLNDNWNPEMICWDDCWYQDGKINGKGKLGIPYLLNNGWKLNDNWILTK